MSDGAPAGPPHPSVEHFSVAIIGSGFGGLGMAIKLRQQGVTDFVVLERGADVGGTWRDNTYPGAACDVPSNLYSFSFAPNPGWSRSFSPGPEIQSYLQECADRFAVRPHIRFHTEVTGATWSDDEQRWTLATATGGKLTADVVVSARGPLSEPALPDIEGIDTFEGTVFHSARWDHGHDLTGERVAVLGTGASAIQFVPQIQPQAAHLTVFQRTPPWVIPRRDRPLSRAEHALYRRVPAVQRAVRGALYWGRELFVLGFVGPRRRRRRFMAGAERLARHHLSKQVPDPELRAVLAPHYEMGCKRILISNDYYPSLTQPNVEVVPEALARIGPRSVTDTAGRQYPVDTLVLGTGFDITGGPALGTIVGRHGVTLADAWAGHMAAYKGTTVAGFPNLFFIVGPNSGLGHNSIVFIIEAQIGYVLQCHSWLRRRGMASAEVRPDVQEAFNQSLAARSAGSVWTAGGCRSYYLDAAGRNVGIWPGSSWSFARALRHFDPEAYRLVARRAPGAPAAVQPAAPGAPAAPVPVKLPLPESDPGPSEPARAGAPRPASTVGVP